MATLGAERSVNIPVVISSPGAEEPPHTVQVNVSLKNARTYGELVQKILSAGKNIFRSYSEASNNPTQLLRDLEKAMSSPGNVHLIWDFVAQIHFTETSHTIPQYGKTDAASLSPEELLEYFKIAYTGRRKYILVRLKLQGLDSKSPGAFWGKGNRETTPLQQRPLPGQAGQATSSQRKTTMAEREDFKRELLRSFMIALWMVWALGMVYILMLAKPE
ncbi:hypothetical protein GGR55DRAFT_675142 [Xylaria sp. FL0064]|nr:hypothetical protein GGR55DRAFT_675142 [Xylaria sp. FL0064]